MQEKNRSSFIVPRSSFGRVAVVHDWLTGMRGGEQVLEAILDLVPGAEIFTLFHFRGSVSQKIESHTVHTSSLHRIATMMSDYRKLLPLFPRAVRQWDFSGFDLVISSSHCVAKGIDSGGKPHLCYCHTPMRYIWDRFDDYFPRSKPVQRVVMRAIVPALRRWDVRTAAGVTQFVANSNFVRDRIGKYYEREAEVIHPFVDEAFLGTPLPMERGDHHVVVSALVPYKKVDLAMEAAAASGRRLVVAGGGPLMERLERRGGPNVRLLGYVSRDRIIELVSGARSLILPGIEDFGITALEAMALGTPVVALRGGGVLDSVVEGTTGILFSEPSEESLRAALDQVESRPWDRSVIRAHAATFSRARFEQRFATAVEKVVSAK